MKGPIDEITTVSERVEGVDPILERLKSLKIVSLLFANFRILVLNSY